MKFRDISVKELLNFLRDLEKNEAQSISVTIFSDNSGHIEKYNGETLCTFGNIDDLVYESKPFFYERVKNSIFG